MEERRMDNLFKWLNSSKLSVIFCKPKLRTKLRSKYTSLRSSRDSTYNVFLFQSPCQEHAEMPTILDLMPPINSPRKRMTEHQKRWLASPRTTHWYAAETKTGSADAEDTQGPSESCQESCCSFMQIVGVLGCLVHEIHVFHGVRRKRCATQHCLIAG